MVSFRSRMRTSSMVRGPSSAPGDPGSVTERARLLSTDEPRDRDATSFAEIARERELTRCIELDVARPRGTTSWEDADTARPRGWMNVPWLVARKRRPAFIDLTFCASSLRRGSKASAPTPTDVPRASSFSKKSCVPCTKVLSGSPGWTPKE